jgi:hypothetical protein
MDIHQVAHKAREHFGDKRPSKAALTEWTAMLGAGEVIAIVSLLFSMWAYFNPKSAEDTPKCRKMLRPGKVCGGGFVRDEVEESFLVLTCENGHRTRKRLKA